MGATFAIEDMSWLACTFAFAALRLFAAADVGANLVTADNLYFFRFDDNRFFLFFRHFQDSLGQVRGDIGSNAILILDALAPPG